MAQSKTFSFFIFLALLLSACSGVAEKSIEQMSTIKPNKIPALVIHAGAGTIQKDRLSDEMEKKIRQKLAEALEAGYEILHQGGSSLAAVEKTICILEDAPFFNAGKGAVFTHNATHELDASVMDGKRRIAGAIGGVKRVKNPIKAAIAVMENTEHVMLIGEGADEFAQAHKLEMVENDYFSTPDKKAALEKALKRGKVDISSETEEKFGTVGAVAIDKNGNIAAGTSTGGMTNKKFGRVGDSPIIGAGTYAENGATGISSTGYGEFFIREVVAFDINAIYKYQNKSITAAAKEVIHDKLLPLGGAGGVIGLDHNGEVVMDFNTAGMYRGYIQERGAAKVAIFKGEEASIVSDQVELSDQLEKLHFEIKIAAKPEVIYECITEQRAFRTWTQVFHPTSHFKGNWSEGSEIHFLSMEKDGTLNGMISEVTKNEVNKMISVAHLGYIQNGKEIRSGAAAAELIGAHEHYTIEDQGSHCTLKIDTDTFKEMKAFFEEGWPQALKVIKGICEGS